MADFVELVNQAQAAIEANATARELAKAANEVPQSSPAYSLLKEAVKRYAGIPDDIAEAVLDAAILTIE
jgi:hypothetical protein